MKSKVFVMVLVFMVLLALAVTPVLAAGSAQADGPEGFQLDAVAFFIIGLAISGLHAFLSFVGDLFARRKLETPNWIKQVAVYVVAYGLAFYFAPFVLPTFPSFTGDLGTDISLFIDGWAIPLFMVLSAWFVLADRFYNWFVKSLKNKSGEALHLSGYGAPVKKKG